MMIIKQLHITKILSLAIIAAIILAAQGNALTMKTAEHYYLVSPKNEYDVQAAIYDASPMLMDKDDAQSHKYVGLHKAQYIGPQYTLKYNNKLCFIDVINIRFNSNIYLPKLDRDVRHYTDKTMMKFDAEFYEIRTHELKHRQIYVNGLQSALNELRAINQKNSNFQNCLTLKQHIQKVMDHTHASIIQKNLDLDCYEYGNKLNLAICKNSGTQHQKATLGSFSSLVQDDNAKTNVISYKEKPQNDECQGKLIEPFKGKFYCVPEDSYSEP